MQILDVGFKGLVLAGLGLFVWSILQAQGIVNAPTGSIPTGTPPPTLVQTRVIDTSGPTPPPRPTAGPRPAGFAPAGGPPPPATPTTPVCHLATWADGSQSCSDGTPIDEEHGQPGYCVVVQFESGEIACNDGKPAGLVFYAEEDPLPTPWDASPNQATTLWIIEANCVKVTLPERTQTVCKEPGQIVTAEEAAYMATRIEMGDIPPDQTGIPRG